jgi:large subunit ribosomal protein L2
MIKRVKPTSPGRRGQTYLVRETLTKRSDVSKSVIKRLETTVGKGAVGRSHGRTTIFNRRVGAKKQYRIIDFKRDKLDVPAKVIAIEYDPNRTCNIALVLYADGEYRYILAPQGLKIGDKVLSSLKTDIKPGNAMSLANIPLGVAVHNIELYPSAGGKFIRTAGGAAFVTAKEGDYVNVKMQSGEVRRFLGKCFATIGQLSNEEWKLIKLGKAGRSYHKGRRPKVRAKTRAYGHPLAGSYKRRLGRQPVDKWGNLSKGKKTRSRKHTNKYIVSDRRAKKA